MRAGQRRSPSVYATDVLDSSLLMTPLEGFVWPLTRGVSPPGPAPPLRSQKAAATNATAAQICRSAGG
jgi:hypothetical protein